MPSVDCSVERISGWHDIYHKESDSTTRAWTRPIHIADVTADCIAFPLPYRCVTAAADADGELPTASTSSASSAVAWSGLSKLVLCLVCLLWAPEH